jgi:hypothetical protein
MASALDAQPNRALDWPAFQTLPTTARDVHSWGCKEYIEVWCHYQLISDLVVQFI